MGDPPSKGMNGVATLSPKPRECWLQQDHSESLLYVPQSLEECGLVVDAHRPLWLLA